LHAEVETLLRRRKRLKNTIPILGALYALFADIDQNYDRVKKSLVAQMAQLQIESISECTQRQLLVRELKCAFEAANVFETETLPDIIMQVLADRTVLEENPYLNRVLSAHPEIARAAHKIIEFRQPNLDRFQALRQQIQHSSNHRITGLQAVADSLDRYGFNDFSKEIRLEALGVENRLARR
jgi:hypothetical protein